jgi:predicted metal-dependent hydrolase
MPDPELKEGARLFDAGRFWEAHEAWEQAWKRLPKGSDERRFYQGLILLAAAFLHRERGKTAPAVRCYRSAMEKLEGLPDETMGLDLAALRRAAAGCFEPVAAGAGPEAWPPPPALGL